MKQLYKDIAQKWIDDIESSRMPHKDKKKKIVEICHFASFVISLLKCGHIRSVKDVQIIMTCEEPDFIIKYGKEIYGLEIRRIKNERSDIIGKQENLLESSAMLFQQKYEDYNVLVNISFTNKFNFKQNDKKLLSNEIADYVYNVLSNTTNKIPQYIRRISIQKHSGVSFNLTGGYVVGALSESQIIQEINSKESKIETYKDKSNLDKIVLLLVVSGASPDSDYSFLEIPINVKTEFHHIYLLNDFDKKVHIIK